MALSFPNRQYTGSAYTTTLTSAIAATGEGTFTVSDASSWLDVTTAAAGHTGTEMTGGFVVVVDYGTTSEEKILCSGLSGNTVTIASGGRGYDGTSLTNHLVGKSVVPCVTASEFAEYQYLLRQVLDNATATGDLIYATGVKTLGHTSLTPGGILYGGSAGPAYTTAGSANQFLQANGSGGYQWAAGPIPSHAQFDNSGGSAQSLTANGATEQRTTLTMSGTYHVGNDYPLIASNVVTPQKTGLYKITLRTGIQNTSTSAAIQAALVTPTLDGSGTVNNFGSTVLSNALPNAISVCEVVIPINTAWTNKSITPQISITAANGATFTVPTSAGRNVLTVTYLGPLA